MTNTEWNYRPGSVISYYPFGSTTPRTVLVTLRDPDVKRGEPGFEGVVVDQGEEVPVWGYDHQIVRVDVH